MDVDEHKNEDPSLIKDMFLGCLNDFFHQHFGLNSTNDTSRIGCPGMSNVFLNQLVEARDRQWIQIGNSESNRHIDRKLFVRLIQLLIEAHVNVFEVISYFKWASTPMDGQRKRPRRIASVGKTFSERRKATFDAIIGGNQSLLKKKTQEIEMSRKSVWKRRKLIREANILFDDIIFIKHLKGLAYFDLKNYDSNRFQKNVLDRCSNKHVYHKDDTVYFVGYVSDSPTITLGEDEKAIMSEEEKYMNAYSSPAMRFVNEDWIDKVLGIPFRMRLMQNCCSMFQLSKIQKKQLSKHTLALAKVEVTHVHKYLCKTTLKQIFCNAIPNKHR